MGAVERALPLLIRVAVGDLVQVQASLIAVNHFNGLRPDGAEGAIDDALGGAISRRAAAGALDGHFGALQFLPAATAPLAAGAVVVIGLGDAEKFAAARLPEVGRALVEAAATLRVRDVATIIHGGGTLGVPRQEAARLLVDGFLAALDDIAGAECLRELVVVEKEADHLPEIVCGIGAARTSPRVHVYVEEQSAVSKEPVAPVQAVAQTADGAIPDHLRIGITRAGPDLKVTVIGHGAFDCASMTGYPQDLANRLPRRLQQEVLQNDAAQTRVETLRSLGHELYEAFLAWTPFDLAALLARNATGYLVLRLDRWTAGLPWEILFHDPRFLCQTQILSRQLEVYAPGRSASPPSDGVPAALVVGDPTGNLEGAAREAHAVAQTLAQVSSMHVDELIHDVTYDRLSAALDSRRYDLLHYAGHAAFDQGAGGAGRLLLADGALAASDLAGRRFLPPLVFVNGCNSAEQTSPANPFSGAESTRDFVSGLLPAGVRTFLGCQWAVQDQAAATFAAGFYRALLQPDAQNLRRRTVVGKAVQLAREAVIREHGESQQAWAAYTLYGNPWAVWP